MHAILIAACEPFGDVALAASKVQEVRESCHSPLTTLPDAAQSAGGRLTLNTGSVQSATSARQAGRNG